MEYTGNVISFKTERLFLREIEENDAGWIVAWRSDENVYKYFKNPHAVTLKEHRNWYRNSYLKNLNRVDLFVTHDNNPVGVFGYSLSDNTAEINYLLDDEAQGMGYAQEVIKGIIDYLKSNFEISRVVAEIHKDNLASIKLAERMNMNLISSSGDFITYGRNI